MKTNTAPAEIIKRDGSRMPFDRYKIRQAIHRANRTVPSEMLSSGELDQLTLKVLEKIDPHTTPGVEQVQDLVEDVLIMESLPQSARSYILYRAEHSRRRDASQKLMQTYRQITFSDASDSDLKRENANIDGNTAMGMMLKYGSEGAKSFIDQYVLPGDMLEAHDQGLIHIHDKDFYMLTATCCQINLTKLFEKGFSTGHGHLRPPKSIASYAALACIAIQANQNEMHGGQSVACFDYAMAQGVNYSAQKHLQDLLNSYRDFLGQDHPEKERISQMDYAALCEALSQSPAPETEILLRRAKERTRRDTYQAMQALIHNLNTMNSRAGAQVPFSSINYGTDISPAGRLVMEELLQATEDGLGNGETAIFPVQIFKVKEGVNASPEDPGYDLFRRAMEVSAKRLFPNFSFLDAPFNREHYQAGDPNTEVAYMGCRTRVLANTADPAKSVTQGRGNLSFTSINLPRLGIEARGDQNLFFQHLDETMALAFRQLRHRFDIQKRKQVKNFPFLMGQGIWIDSEHLNSEDEIEEVLRHGTLSVGFIGLAETLVALTGKHHGHCPESQKLGLKIISHMRELCDQKSREEGLNYTLLATPAEGLSGRFLRLDRARYGRMNGITDHDYYTNSFHLPVYFPVTALDKIRKEAPYHALTNAGHITYIELDQSPAQNIDAFEKIILAMKEAGIGYGSINHPLDRDPVCGYRGIIGEHCPNCGRGESNAEPFQRIRRITGYLVGTLERFNDAKRKEEGERLRHG